VREYGSNPWVLHFFFAFERSSQMDIRKKPIASTLLYYVGEDKDAADKERAKLQALVQKKTPVVEITKNMSFVIEDIWMKPGLHRKNKGFVYKIYLRGHYK
jgi:hypothetical protein